MSRHGDKFSKHGYGGSKQDEVGRTIYERVEKLLESRWKLLCPFDIVQRREELWHYAMTNEQREAWQLLSRDKHFENAINRNNSFDIVNKEGKFRVRVPLLYGSGGVPRWPVNWHNLPTDLRERLHHWMLQSRAYRDEFHTIRDLVKKLVMSCATPGQIERVWPELLGFMPEHVKDQRLDKKARSPYPEGVLDRDYLITVNGQQVENPNFRELLPMWRPEALAWYDTPIAEALILPLYKKPEGEPDYPEIQDDD
jgi:hypothetical protein